MVKKHWVLKMIITDTAENPEDFLTEEEYRKWEDEIVEAIEQIANTVRVETFELNVVEG